MTKRYLKAKKLREKSIGNSRRESQTAVARSLGVNQSTISRLANKEDVKALLEDETLKLLEVVPQAVENLKSLVNEMPEISKKEVKRRELSLKATNSAIQTYSGKKGKLNRGYFTNRLVS